MAPNINKMAPIQTVAPKINKMAPIQNVAPKINKMAPIQHVAPKIEKSMKSTMEQCDGHICPKTLLSFDVRYHEDGWIVIKVGGERQVQSCLRGDVVGVLIAASQVVKG